MATQLDARRTPVKMTRREASVVILTHNCHRLTDVHTHTHSAREEIEDENRRSTAEAGLDNKNFSDTVIELKCTVVGLLSSVVATVFFQCQQCPDDGVLKLVPPPQTSKVTKRLAEHGKRTHTHARKTQQRAAGRQRRRRRRGHRETSRERLKTRQSNGANTSSREKHQQAN